MRKCRIWLVNEVAFDYDENQESSQDILTRLQHSLEETPGVSEVQHIDSQFLSS